MDHSSVTYHPKLGAERFEKQLSEVQKLDEDIHLGFHYPPEFKDLEKICKKLSDAENLTISIWYDPNVISKSQCDYSFLSNFPKLKKLWFKYTPWIDNFDFLADLANLQSLDIRECKNKRISLKPVSKLGDLNKLYLEGYRSDIEYLSHCESLEKLILSKVALNDFSFLRDNQCLWYLKISQSKIQEIIGIDALALKYLELWSMPKLSELSGIAHIKTLEELMLDQLPSLKKIDSLSEAKKLENVKVERCKALHDISGLACAPELTTLRIYECCSLSPKSFEVFKGHPKLQYGIFDVGSEMKNTDIENLLQLASPPGYPEAAWGKFQK